MVVNADGLDTPPYVSLHWLPVDFLLESFCYRMFQVLQLVTGVTGCSRSSSVCLGKHKLLLSLQVNGTEADYEYEEITLERV